MMDVATVLAENEEHLIRLDMEMSDELIDKLLAYSNKNMPVERMIELRVEWAVQDILSEYMTTLNKLSPDDKEKALEHLKEEFGAKEEEE
jgi:hypothetical protein